MRPAVTGFKHELCPSKTSGAALQLLWRSEHQIQQLHPLRHVQSSTLHKTCMLHVVVDPHNCHSSQVPIMQANVSCSNSIIQHLSPALQQLVQASSTVGSADRTGPTQSICPVCAAARPAHAAAYPVHAAEPPHNVTAAESGTQLNYNSAAASKPDRADVLHQHVHNLHSTAGAA